jgi:uncharacterized membrane protein YfhO
MEQESSRARKTTSEYVALGVVTLVVILITCAQVAFLFNGDVSPLKRPLFFGSALWVCLTMVGLTHVVRKPDSKNLSTLVLVVILTITSILGIFISSLTMLAAMLNVFLWIICFIAAGETWVEIWCKPRSSVN